MKAFLHKQTKKILIANIFVILILQRYKHYNYIFFEIFKKYDTLLKSYNTNSTNKGFLNKMKHTITETVFEDKNDGHHISLKSNDINEDIIFEYKNTNHLFIYPERQPNKFNEFIFEKKKNTHWEISLNGFYEPESFKGPYIAMDKKDRNDFDIIQFQNNKSINGPKARGIRLNYIFVKNALEKFFNLHPNSTIIAEIATGGDYQKRIKFWKEFGLISNSKITIKHPSKQIKNNLFDFLKESPQKNINSNIIEKKRTESVRTTHPHNDLRTEHLIELIIKFNFNCDNYRLNINYIDIYDKNLLNNKKPRLLYRKITKIVMNDNWNLINYREFEKEINILLFSLKVFDSKNHHTIQQSFLKKWCDNGNLDFLAIRIHLDKERDNTINKNKIFKTKINDKINNIQSTKTIFSRDMEYVFWLNSEIVFWEGGIINIIEDYSNMDLTDIEKKSGNFEFNEESLSFVTSNFLRTSKAISFLKKETLTYENKNFNIFKFEENSTSFRKLLIGLFFQVFYEFFNNSQGFLGDSLNENEVYEIINKEFSFDIIEAPEGTFIGEDIFAWNHNPNKNSRFVILPLNNVKIILIRKNNKNSKKQIKNITKGKYNKFYIKNMILKPELNYGILLGETYALENNQDLKDVINEVKKPLKDVICLNNINPNEFSYPSIYEAIENNKFETFIKEIKEKTGRDYIEILSIC